MPYYYTTMGIQLYTVHHSILWSAIVGYRSIPQRTTGLYKSLESSALWFCDLPFKNKLLHWRKQEKPRARLANVDMCVPRQDARNCSSDTFTVSMAKFIASGTEKEQAQ